MFDDNKLAALRAKLEGRQNFGPVRDVKVSIVIPVYKAEEFLERCLDSLIDQTMGEIEIILVNDGSPDDSKKIYDEYAKHDGRIVIIEQENQGPSMAYNNGIAAARGEYLGFVDSDDWVDLDYYEKMYDAAKRHDADMACVSIVRQRPNHVKYRVHQTEEIETTDLAKKFELCNIPKCCYIVDKIYRRDKFMATGLKLKEGVYYEDVIFVPQMVGELGKLVTVPGPKYYYWVNTGSIVKTYSEKKEQDKKDAIIEFINYATSHGVQVNTKKMTLCSKWLDILGVPVIKRKEYYPNIVKYVLFGLVTLWAKKEK